MKYTDINFNKKPILITRDINDNDLVKNLETKYFMKNSIIIYIPEIKKFFQQEIK